MQLWDDILDDNPDSEIGAHVNGVATQMRCFDYFFGAYLLRNVLRHTDNLSKTMQHTKMSACEAQSITKMTVTTLQVSDKVAIFYKTITTTYNFFSP